MRACCPSSTSRCANGFRNGFAYPAVKPCIHASMPTPSKLRRAAGNLVAVCISLAVGLGLGEILVRAAFHESMDFDMEMWKYATEIKVPSDDPRVVFEHRPNGKAFLMGVEVTTNSFGLREGERSLAKPPGTYRI